MNRTSTGESQRRPRRARFALAAQKVQFLAGEWGQFDFLGEVTIMKSIVLAAALLGLFGATTAAASEFASHGAGKSANRRVAAGLLRRIRRLWVRLSALLSLGRLLQAVRANYGYGYPGYYGGYGGWGGGYYGGGPYVGFGVY